MVIRIGSGLLGLIHAWWGLWAWLAPAHFFANFPGLGHRWTAAYPPYNEHLVSDLGSTFLTLAFLLFVAAVWNDARVTAVVLSGLIVFSAAHLGYHLGHHGLLTGTELAAATTSLVLGVLAPAVLLVLVFRRRAAGGGRTAPR